MTIHLPEDLQRYVQGEVLSGRFASEDEAITEALRLLRRNSQTPEGQVEPPGEEEFERICTQFLRARWMRAMGATEEDIAEYCDLTRHPGSVTEELDNLKDLEQLQLKNLSHDELEKLSRRFAKSPMR